MIPTVPFETFYTIERFAFCKLKVVTLIFISGPAPAILPAKQGKSNSIFNLVKY